MTSGLIGSKWILNHLDFSDIHIQFGDSSSGQITHGHLRSDGWAFLFQIGGPPTFANGIEIDRRSAFVIACGDAFVLNCESGHAWFSVFLPNAHLFGDGDALRRYAGRMGESRVIRLDESHQATIRQFWDSHRDHDGADVLVDHDKVVDFAQQLLLLPSRRANYGKRAWRDWIHVIHQALEFIEAYEYMNPPISQLVEKLPLSERSVRNMFARFFGVSPNKFIQLRRLRECRRLLRDTVSVTEGTTVSSIAAELGFWDMGRFSLLYRQVYRELPSVTLASTRFKKKNNQGD
ncbi:MAG: helix-turn-helix domain-containing protein [Geminicoccaceae bacterium]